MTHEEAKAMVMKELEAGVRRSEGGRERLAAVLTQEIKSSIGDISVAFRECLRDEAVLDVATQIMLAIEGRPSMAILGDLERTLSNLIHELLQHEPWARRGNNPIEDEYLRYRASGLAQVISVIQKLIIMVQNGLVDTAQARAVEDGIPR